MATLTLTAAANAAAQMLQCLDAGESLTTQNYSDALLFANNIWDNWSSDGLMILALVKTFFTTSVGTQPYTIGPAQTINIARPVEIASADFLNGTGPGGNLEVCNVQKWASIPDRQKQSFLLQYLFWDRGNPTGTIYLSPVPAGTLAVDLWYWVPLSQFADTTTPLTMLPGYERAIIAQLAMDMAPYFDVEPTPQLQANYADAMARVRHLNAQIFGLEPPSGDVSAASGGQIPPNAGAQ